MIGISWGCTESLMPSSITSINTDNIKPRAMIKVFNHEPTFFYQDLKHLFSHNKL
jgi:hypothetical protein